MPSPIKIFVLFSWLAMLLMTSGTAAGFARSSVGSLATSRHAFPTNNKNKIQFGSGSRDLSTKAVMQHIVLEPDKKILAGKVRANLAKFKIFKAMNVLGLTVWRNIVLAEAAAITGIAFGTVPATRYIYNRFLYPKRKVKKLFKETRLSVVAHVIGEFGKFVLLVYGFDLLYALLVAAGLPAHNRRIPRQLAVFVYTMYVATVIRKAKKGYLERKYGMAGKGIILNTLFNIMITTVASLVVFGDCLDAIGKGFGLSFESLFKFGGIGSVFAGFAAQDPAKDLSGGLLLAFQEKFGVGDTVLLEDGSEDRIVKIGLVETTMIDKNGHEAQVQNSVLMDQNVVNLSRLPTSRLSENVRLRHSDVPEIEVLFERLEKEIKTSCPNVVSDGSLPFNIHWTEWSEYEAIQITIECYLNIPPLGTDYLNARQCVYQAIARAGYLDDEGFLNVHDPDGE